MARPPQKYQGYLPLFPDVYLLAVTFPGSDWKPLDVGVVGPSAAAAE